MSELISATKGTSVSGVFCIGFQKWYCWWSGADNPNRWGSQTLWGYN